MVILMTSGMVVRPRFILDTAASCRVRIPEFKAEARMRSGFAIIDELTDFFVHSKQFKNTGTAREAGVIAVYAALTHLELSSFTSLGESGIDYFLFGSL
jgi:hypothetical protein